MPPASDSSPPMRHTKPPDKTLSGQQQDDSGPDPETRSGWCAFRSREISLYVSLACLFVCHIHVCLSVCLCVYVL